MRKFLAIAASLTLVLMSGFVWADETWVDFGSHRSPSPVGVSLDQSDATVLEFEIEIPGVLLRQVTEEGQAFTMVEIPGAGQIGDLGTPLLPAFRRFVEIPIGATIRSDVNVISWESVSLADRGFNEQVYPVQMPRAKCAVSKSDSWQFSYKDSAYEGVTAHEIVSWENPVTMRDHRMVELTISPVRYDAVNGRLQVAERIRVSLDFEGGDIAATLAQRERLSSRSFDAFVGSSSLNLVFSGATQREMDWTYPSDAPVEFLVITPPQFEADLAPFVEWKTSCGFNMNVVTTDVAGTTTSAIKTFITGLYNGPNPPVYILMIGDSPNPLATYTPSGGGTGGTDLPYVQMDSDIYPDMMIARWPIDDSVELVNMMNKILTYEFPTVGTSAYLNRALFLAGDDYEGRVTTHEDVIAELMEPAPNSAEVDLWYGTANPSTTMLINDLNQGRAWAVYSAHSGPSG